MLQQTRDQRVPPPRAAYNYAGPMLAGFLTANGVMQGRGLDFLDTARAFVLLGMTQGDAAINAWNSKYEKA